MDGDTHIEFSTITDARSMFEYGLSLISSTHSTQISCEAECSPELLQGHVDYCTVLLAEFSNALHTLVNTRGPSLTPKEKVSVAALQLHVLNSYVSFYVEYLPPAYRPPTNTLLPKMKEMVSLCEEIISYISPETSLQDQRTSFCLDIGYIIPLYTVASQCQDMATRRRAIALLRSTPRQEGLWNSLVVARAAERILEIEGREGEQLTPCAPVAEPPASPSPSTVLQLDGRGVRLQYVKPGNYTAAPISVVEEVVTW